MRIVVLGGGFGGVATARHLERVLRKRADVELTLVSRENFFVITPLLFEACSGRLELRHCAQPIRAALRWARFIEATVESVDAVRQSVRAVAPEAAPTICRTTTSSSRSARPPTTALIPGSPHAFTFKTMADALVLRNHVIERFERADAAADAATRRGLPDSRRDRRRPRRRRAARRAHGVCRRCAAFLSAASGERRCASVCSRPARASCRRSTPSWRPTATRVLERRGADIRVSTPVRSSSLGVCTCETRLSRPARSCSRRASCPTPSRAPFPSCTTSAAGSRSTRRCGATAIRTCGRWATARRSRDRMGGPTPRSPSTPSARDAARAQHRGGRRRPRAVALRVPIARHDGLPRPYSRRRARVRRSTHGLPRLVDPTDLLPVSDAALGPPTAHRPRLDRRALLPAGHHEGRLAGGAGAGEPGAPIGGEIPGESSVVAASRTPVGTLESAGRRLSADAANVRLEPLGVAREITEPTLGDLVRVWTSARFPGASDHLQIMRGQIPQ